MDLCHVKNSELEPQFQKYKGRVVLRGDIVKGDSGSHTVFTEQGSSASQMTAAKVMDLASRLPGCVGQAADAVSAETQVKMQDAPSSLKVPKSDVQMFGYVYQSTYGLNDGPVRKIQSRKFVWKTDGKKFRIGSAYSLTERKGYSCLCTWTISKWQERNKIWIQCGRYL